MLNNVNYPVEAQVIIIMGQPALYERSWMISPLLRGDYSLIIYPRGMLDLSFSVFRFDVFCAAGDQAPEQLRFEVPVYLRSVKEWEWKFIKWDRSMDLHLEDKAPSVSELLFEHQLSAEGSFALKPSGISLPHTLVVWSCNQPFETNANGEAILHAHAEAIFDWYARQVSNFKPDVIWGLGDTGYSDGTEATDFINQYYNNPQVLNSSVGKESLLKAYRRMYKGHWSFRPLQEVMRNFPHITVWDDHEIRDGWGSESNDFEKSNTVIFQQARKVAGEFILNNGPRVVPDSDSGDAPNDAHQAYVEGNIASFVFDGRSSRKYSDPNGQVVSASQLEDFRVFCQLVAQTMEVKFLLMGSAVPFINLKDFIERLGANTPDFVNELVAEIRDDVRDSWHSPGNINQLKKMISIIRQLHRNRPDINIVNISGDIHVANLFSFQPLGFTRALYQVTTSALTNREHPSELLNDLLQVGTEAWSEALGLITRIWPTVSEPNILKIEPVGQDLQLSLKVFDTAYTEKASRPLDSSMDLVYRVGHHRLVGEHLLPV
ncbi:alkaline phosphatase D family protein [Carboxylicivirga taeanensis]|uniref:alkaline phosphatase D family protein n=1 Tax=Carboxylicivirga taeanensis TaxID=1416875 RepID=UPI003F6DFBB9